uniref:Uncharacterized protein n=1 Tax=Opuntia streptacantha TaxID=393608 RepID=A0A7C8YNI9_OPUST
MAIVAGASTSSELFNTPLLSTPDKTVAGAVDYRRRTAVRSESGRWRSACFIIVVEMAERFSYYGLSSNLITFLTEKLGQSTAAANVNAWSGVACLLPILGGLIADYLLGKYYAILASSFLYVLVSANSPTLLY